MPGATTPLEGRAARFSGPNPPGHAGTSSRPPLTVDSDPTIDYARYRSRDRDACNWTLGDEDVPDADEPRPCHLRAQVRASFYMQEPF